MGFNYTYPVQERERKCCGRRIIEDRKRRQRYSSYNSGNTNLDAGSDAELKRRSTLRETDM